MFTSFSTNESTHPFSTVSLSNPNYLEIPKQSLELRGEQRAPLTIDCNLLGRCNLKCPWCWGPDHEALEQYSLNDWKKLLEAFKALGTENVVVTGGEPLLKGWLPNFIKYAKQDLGMRVTLSTNGILLHRVSQKILPYVDDLGIPLDGPSPGVNQMMRQGKFPHFDIALEAIKFVQSQYPNVELTMRTVVAKPNMEFVPKIGAVLLQYGISPEKLRWKLYQVNPIGPRKDDILKGDWLVSAADFNRIINKVKELNPQFPNICAQPFERHVGRYFMVFPDGASHVIERGSDGYPQEKIIGNVFQNLDLVIKTLTSGDYVETNDAHGVRLIR